MTELSHFQVEAVQKELECVDIHPALDGIVDVIASQSPNSSYISPSQLSKRAVELLLITQPIIVIQQNGKYLCVCGLRTLHATKVTYGSSDSITVHIIQNPEMTADQFAWIAHSDVYLKTFVNMYMREPKLLAKLYDQIGKELIKSIVPRHQLKKQFANDAGFSRQRVFYQYSP